MQRYHAIIFNFVRPHLLSHNQPQSERADYAGMNWRWVTRAMLSSCWFTGGGLTQHCIVRLPTAAHSMDFWACTTCFESTLERRCPMAVAQLSGKYKEVDNKFCKASMWRLERGWLAGVSEWIPSCAKAQIQTSLTLSLEDFLWNKQRWLRLDWKESSNWDTISNPSKTWGGIPWFGCEVYCCKRKCDVTLRLFTSSTLFGLSCHAWFGYVDLVSSIFP